MFSNPRFTVEDLPDSPHSRQLRAGFPWLTFDASLEAEFLESHLNENLLHIRINLCLLIAVELAFSAVASMFWGAALNRVPALIQLGIVVPVMLLTLGVSFTARRQQWFPKMALASAVTLGLSVVAVHLVASMGGVPLLFPCVVLSAIFIYFMGGLPFYNALAVNVFVIVAYVVAGIWLRPPGPAFGFDAISLVAVNIFAASVVYMHEKISRMRFLEAGLLREMVAKDGLTGIQNRRMFDQHIQRGWQQGVRESKRVAVLLVDIDCFKDYNDRYGHQAGDECLRAVAVCLSQCARRPMDFVARYGGEEFAMVLYDATRDYVAEVLTRIQRSIAQLNIPHEASRVASRLTVSIGAAFAQPGPHRTHNGLVQLADEALYSAKEQGRNRVVVMENEYQSLHTGRFEKRRIPGLGL